MAWVHLLGRKFAQALTDPKFDLLADWPYWNRFQVQGHCYYGLLRGRRFCLSQSRCDAAEPMPKLARVFRDGNSVDPSCGPFYSNSKGEIGLLVTAWNGSQWIQMISPGTPDQPEDQFRELSDKISADRTIDPQPVSLSQVKNDGNRSLQELIDILGSVRGRRDFEW